MSYDRSPKKAPQDPARIDAVDGRLLVALSRDGRRPAADLAKEMGLSRQAVTERIRDLERRGVIRGYRADIDPSRLGLTVRAFLRLTLDGVQGPVKEKEMVRTLLANPLVRSVHRVSGEDCFVVQVICRGLGDVNTLLGQIQAIRALQASRTAFVLETIIDKSGLGPLEAALLPVED